jgi:hypothetical protein
MTRKHSGSYLSKCSFQLVLVDQGGGKEKRPTFRRQERLKGFWLRVSCIRFKVYKSTLVQEIRIRMQRYKWETQLIMIQFRSKQNGRLPGPPFVRSCVVRPI